MSISRDLPTSTEELKAQARQAALKVGDHLSDQANYLRDTAADARYNTQEYIQDHPWQSVAMAAGIGFILGAILTRR